MKKICITPNAVVAWVYGEGSIRGVGGFKSPLGSDLGSIGYFGVNLRSEFNNNAISLTQRR